VRNDKSIDFRFGKRRGPIGRRGREEPVYNSDAMPLTTVHQNDGHKLVPHSSLRLHEQLLPQARVLQSKRHLPPFKYVRDSLISDAPAAGLSTRSSRLGGMRQLPHVADFDFHRAAPAHCHFTRELRYSMKGGVY